MNEAVVRGEIAAGESTYVRVFPLGHNKAFEYVNDTAHSLFLTSIIVNKDFFAKFDEETQNIMADAAATAARIERRESVADIPNILAECEKENVPVVRMSKEEEAKFKSITSKVYELYKDYFSPGLVPALIKA
jgi:TRAP-type C4-dicarboxylate transport system substrate-binding protein